MEINDKSSNGANFSVLNVPFNSPAEVSTGRIRSYGCCANWFMCLLACLYALGSGLLSIDD